MKKLSALFVIVVCALLVEVGQGEEAVYFADAKLKLKVEAALGIIDPTPTQMLGLTSLGASQYGISDLTGLEYAVNLTGLYLFDNNISDITPLAGLTNLTGLYLYDNRISDITPLAGLTNLVGLYIYNNNISDITPLAGLTNLKGLSLFNNNISDITPVAGLTNLTALYIFDNNISDISPLANLTKLNYLWLFNNNISDITPLARLTNLITLELFGNNISDIQSLAGLINLKGLYLHNNHISDITSLASLKNLKGLGLSNNSISDISPLANLRNLNGLDLRQNPLNEQAYTLWIPQITANNPGISIHLWYDPYFPGTLVVVYPKGGEKLYGGTRKTITWESDGISQVEIKLSDDGGQTWTVIASAVPSVDGLNKLFWIVPQLKSAQCLIRVVKMSKADASDDSDAWFTINRCGISVYDGDLTGDCRVDMADSAIVASNWLKDGIEDE